MQNTINHTNSLQNLGWQSQSFSSSNPKLNLSALDIKAFVETSEEYAIWEAMMQRAAENKAVGSQQDAKYLLQNQELIPSEWQKYNLIFPQTVWTSVTGHKLCPFLSCKEGHWVINYYWFLYDFHHNDRFLVKKS